MSDIHGTQFMSGIHYTQNRFPDHITVLLKALKFMEGKRYVIGEGDNFSMLPAYVKAITLLYFIHTGCIYLIQDTC